MACWGTRALGDGVPLVLSQSQEAALPPWWPSGAQPIGRSTASSRRRRAGGDVQNTRAADVQSRGEAPQQSGAGQGWPRLGIRTRTPLSLPPSNQACPCYGTERQVWRGETRGGCGRCPRGHSPVMRGPAPGSVPSPATSSVSASQACSQHGGPPGLLLTPRRQEPRRQHEPRWLGHDRQALRTCSTGHGTARESQSNGIM